MNSARARRSTQMCDECDDTRSLDFSNDFFEHRMNSPHLYPPQYLAWWKPPSSYFPPRGEAPPPYEEAVMATTSLGGNNMTSTTTTIAMPPYLHNLHNNNNHHNSLHIQGGGVATTILNDIPIIVPPPVLPPGTGARSSPAAIQRLASAIANATSSGGSTTCATTVTTVTTSSSPSTAPPTASSHNPNRAIQHGEGHSGKHHTKISKGKSKSSKSKSSKNKDKHLPPPPPAPNGEPQPGPSRLDAEMVDISRTFRIGPPQHGPAPPTYEDAIYSLHPTPRTTFYDHHRHSLTLPPRRLPDGSSSIGGGSYLYPRVVVHDGAGPMTCYTEEEMMRRAHNQHPRYSLQFNVGDTGGGNRLGGDWSSSSSTLSLSTAPNSPVGRAPLLSSSSESSVSESNPPPPPAPTSNNTNSSNNNTPRA